MNTIKLISKENFKKLLEKGILGECHMPGNISEIGRHSCGYYDVEMYNKGKVENLGTENYLKTVYAHVGVSLTRNKVYIMDKYANIATAK